MKLNTRKLTIQVNTQANPYDTFWQLYKSDHHLFVLSNKVLLEYLQPKYLGVKTMHRKRRLEALGPVLEYCNVKGVNVVLDAGRWGYEAKKDKHRLRASALVEDLKTVQITDFEHDLMRVADILVKHRAANMNWFEKAMS